MAAIVDSFWKDSILQILRLLIDYMNSSFAMSHPSESNEGALSLEQ